MSAANDAGIPELALQAARDHPDPQAALVALLRAHAHRLTQTPSAEMCEMAVAAGVEATDVDEVLDKCRKYTSNPSVACNG